MKIEDRLKEFYSCDCPSHVHQVNCECGCEGGAVEHPAYKAVALLRKALPYGVHFGNCKWNGLPGKKCSCGLFKLIRDSEEFLNGKGP